ncbi:ANTAR domain-containing protein [Streptomyces sp. NPDC093990]|uniref:ANTAR domain-containing protein n=1 Tax=Streptomyces sp. NPDC093990 TaxID=3155306 RepID=UPI00344595D8
MKSRLMIDMARGMLTAGHGFQPEQAWQLLPTVSQHTNAKLRTVAEDITRVTARSLPRKGRTRKVVTALQPSNAGMLP